MSGCRWSFLNWDAGWHRGVAALVDRDLEESGVLVETRALTGPAHTRRITVQEELPVVTDGPTPRPKSSGRLLDRGV